MIILMLRICKTIFDTGKDMFLDSGFLWINVLPTFKQNVSVWDL